jgi:alkylated DNA repair dioxygenase AlkB
MGAVKMSRTTPFIALEKLVMSNAMKSPYWLHIPGLWPTRKDDRPCYDILLDEVRQDLSVGTVELYGKVHMEGRMTALYSREKAVMKYSGRTLEPQKPKSGGYVDAILEMFSDDDFRGLLCADYPDLIHVLPRPNAAFINWYRPPSQKMDGLGPHSDDTAGMTSDVIISITLCELNGERLFTMHDKSRGNKAVWQAELNDGDILIMLPGCQRLYKHSVSKRLTHLNKSRITGGRLNITLRALRLEQNDRAARTR